MLNSSTRMLRNAKISSSLVIGQSCPSHCAQRTFPLVRGSVKRPYCSGCAQVNADLIQQDSISRFNACRCSAYASSTSADLRAATTSAEIEQETRSDANSRADLSSILDEQLSMEQQQQKQQQSVPQWMLSVRRAPNVPALYHQLARMRNLNHGPLIHCSMVKLAHLIRYQNAGQSQRRAVKLLSKDLVLAAKAVSNQLTPRAAVDILWCFGYIPYKDPVLIHQLVSSLHGKLHTLPQPSLFKLITTLARVRYPLTRSWMDNFVGVVSPHVSSMSPEQLAALLLSCKELKYTLPDSVLEQSCLHLTSQLQTCKLATLGVLVDSLPSTYQPQLSWQEGFMSAMQEKLQRATPKELAQILSGLPRMKCKCSDALLVELLSECLEQLQAFSAQELVTVISGLAALRVKPDSTWMQAFMFQTKDRLPEFLASELSSLVLSFARLGHTPSPAWLQAVCRQAEARLVFAGPGEAASLLYGLSKIGYQPEPGFVSRFTQHTRFKLCLLEPPQAVELFSALGGLQFPVNAAWCSELFYSTEQLLGSFTPSMLVELVAGLAAWQVCPPPVWQSSLAAALTAQMQHFRDPQRVSLITSLRKLSRNDTRLEPVLAAVITQLWEHTQPQVTYHMPSASILQSGSSQGRGSDRGADSAGRGLDTLRFGSTGLDQRLTTGAPNPYVLIRL